MSPTLTKGSAPQYKEAGEITTRNMKHNIFVNIYGYLLVDSLMPDTNYPSDPCHKLFLFHNSPYEMQNVEGGMYVHLILCD